MTINSEQIKALAARLQMKANEAKQSDDWGCDSNNFHDVATPDNILSLLAEREADKALIAELQTVRAAAEKLVRCKGRYHSEQNYRALAALFGVKTPDLPPLDSEARTLTVKLPDNCEHDVIAPVCSFMYESGFEIDTQDYNAVAGRVLSEVETVLRRTLLAAGITLVVEE